MPSIALVGEAYGEEEARWGRPFVGKAGEQLNALLTDAGIRREDCFITNVFNLRPKDNDLAHLCGGIRDPDIIPGLPALEKGLYLRKEFEGELLRLGRQLEETRPNVVVALGNTACWALLGQRNISKIRGAATHATRLCPGVKLLPTYHPAAVLRQYDLRHVTVLDLIKARREGEFPELRRPIREIWLDPALEDIEMFYTQYILPAKRIAFDVETAFNQITCIGFAPSNDRAIVIPFRDRRFPDALYWPTVEAEVMAWEMVRRFFSTQAEYIAQNGLYDVQYLWKAHGIPARVDQDTMLLHHALQPESPKSLGFLGSVYTNEIAWKPNRPKGKHAEKPEDSE